MTRSTSGMSRPLAATSVVIRTLYFDPLTESFQDHLTLVLRDVAVEHLRFLLDGIAEGQLVRVPLGLAEHHGAPMVAAIHLDDVTYGPSAFVVAALNG